MMMNWVSKRTDTTNRINTTVGEIIFNGMYVKNQPQCKVVFSPGTFVLYFIKKQSNSVNVTVSPSRTETESLSVIWWVDVLDGLRLERQLWFFALF